MMVSACLLGVKCRYDGSDFYYPHAEELLREFILIPFCPELLAGMPTPRPAVEIVGGRAKTRAGEDQTRQFRRGAKKSIDLANRFKAKIALLKSGSPSCGCDWTYDGTFSDKLIEGQGFAARSFAKNGIKTFSELNFPIKRVK
jgi:uncharacterized protein YbbK (DUF523 family)